MRASTSMMDNLVTMISMRKSPLCVELNPTLDIIPIEIMDRHAAKAYRSTPFGVNKVMTEFNNEVLDILREKVPAVQLDFHFYAQFGKDGIEAYQETIKNAKKNDFIVIAKVGGTDVTNQKWIADSHLGKVDMNGTLQYVYDVDFIILDVNDKSFFVETYVNTCIKNGKGFFLNLGDRYTHDRVRGYNESISKYNFIGDHGYSNGGLYTFIHYDELRRMRDDQPKLFIMIKDCALEQSNIHRFAGGFDRVTGAGCLVNSSQVIRAIKHPSYKDMDWRKAIKSAVMEMSNELVRVSEVIGGKSDD